MAEGVARAQRWPHGALRAGRAAAFLTLATGVNGTITAYLPTWEPRWIYVAVVGLVAALDGWIIGLIAAAGAVLCYELMSFGAFRFVADRDALLFAAAIVAALAARALRLAIHRPAPQPVKERPLLTGFTIAPATAPDAAMQEASASLRRSLDEERTRSERERTLRIEQENRARALLEELTTELRTAKTQIAELTQQRANLGETLTAHRLELSTSAAHIDGLERTATDLRNALAEANEERSRGQSRIADLENELRSTHENQAREQSAFDQLRGQAHELKEENSELQHQLADVAAARDAAIARAESAEREREELSVRIAGLEVAHRDAEAKTADLQWSHTQLQQRLADHESALATADQRHAQLSLVADELRANLASSEAARAELARAAETAAEANAQQRSEFDQLKYRLESEWSEKLARNAVELTDRLNSALMESDARVDSARAEAATLLQRVGDLERENAGYRSQLEEEFGTAVNLNERLQQLENENAEIRRSAAEFRTNLESQWREKLEERDTAIERMRVSLSVADQRAQKSAEEASELARRLDELQRAAAELQDATRAAAGASSELQSLRDQLAGTTAQLEEMRRAHEQAVETTEALLARTQELESENQSLVASAQLSWETENAAGALRGRLAELDSELQAARNAFAEEQRKTESEWSEKFARSAMEVTARFQSELAAAAEESARYREEAARLTDRLTLLADENTAIRDAAATEKARLESEWNEKLQTIVTHLASDHEQDLGEATLEREEAKAEARRLSNKLSQFESRARDVAVAFEELQNQNQSLRAEIEALKQQSGEGGGYSDSEWNAKLAANALELTQRFNASMATAEARANEARRESQNLALRIKELEQINSTLRMADQERRAAIDAEWSEKLETIVNHLATDHEADVGQATIEREEARAEARMHAMKAEKFQKALQEQLATLERARGEWMAEREQLLRSIDVLRRRMGLGTFSGTTPLPQAGQPERTNPAVLVVHRDSAVRAIAKHALEASGYEVTTASDGLEAFRMATAQRPDVILAEASMPKLDGRELVQMLKSRPETAAVKIVLMADAHGGSGRYSMSDFRADDFLHDPANIEALKTTLANVLGARV